MTLEHYLTKYHRPATVKVYRFEIRHYLRWMGPAAAEQASYADVLRYVEYLRGRAYSPGSLNRIIHALKHYYCYLQAVEKRTDHPCRLLRILDAKRTAIQTQDLLSDAEL